MPIVLALGAVVVGGLVAANVSSNTSSKPQKASNQPQAAANPQSYVVTPLPSGTSVSNIHNLIV